MKYLEIKAPAKINIGLNVVSKRQDSYHNIETIFYPLTDLYDEIIITKSDSFHFTSNVPDLVNDQNLVIKAKELLEEKSKKKFPVKIELNKRIPIGAGLGGGSSDAAAVLLGLNEMFSLKYDTNTLKIFALQLGSDVPFFIFPKPSFATGRGEQLSLLNTEITLPILIVNPGIHISTKEAYQNILPKKPDYYLKEVFEIGITDLIEQKRLTNDFEEFVFKKHPEIAGIKEKLYSSGAMFALMSGSGSTVYGIFNSLNDAIKGQEKFPKEYYTFIQLYND